ncbi:MAG: type IV secretion system DNA-binding domain-containing protein [Chloroflexi bacterium]|nr:type IV secretion system DNA-binding domain-containing protein [Chloroflexota bacterium]
MPRRYYDDDYVYGEFVGWALVLTGSALATLAKALRLKPERYRPVAPDVPRHIGRVEGLLGSMGIDWSNAKLPKIDITNLTRPQVSWDPGDRPQLVKHDTGETFAFPRINGKPATYSVSVAKGPFSEAASLGLIQTLAGICPRLSYEIVADGKSLTWQIVDYEGNYSPSTIIDTIKTNVPSAVVTVGDPLHEIERQYPFYRQLITFGLANEYPAPIPYLADLKDGDPLLTLTSRMNLLRADLEERVKLQLLVFVASDEAVDRSTKRLVEGIVKPLSGLYKTNDPFSGMDKTKLNTKLAGPLYHCFLAVTLESREERRLNELAAFAHDLGQFALPQHNQVQVKGAEALRRVVPSSEHAGLPWFEGMLTGFVQTKHDEWRQLLMVLCPQEMAGLWHLPHENFAATRIAWATAAVPEAVTTAEAGKITIGMTVGPGKPHPISIAPKDRSYHHYITGKTGMGKTTLMHNLIHQDIAAGHGVALIDPHGQLTDAILARSIPEDRHDDLVLLLGSSAEAPMPLNPLRVPKGASRETAFTMIYWTMRKIYESIWREGQMDITMRNVLSALLTDPDATPLDIERLFSDIAYRKKLTAAMEDNDDTSFATLQFWKRFGKQSEAEHRELARPILNRTSAFLGNQQLELMTCHPNTLDIADFIRKKKIVLINLSGDAIKSEVGALGAILMSSFFLASESIGYQDGGEPPRFYLYVDELEKFVTSPVDDILSQARKFGLSVTLANQYLGQMSPGTLESILGNVGHQFIFEIGDKDIPTLAPVTEPDVPRTQLLNLGAHHMAVKTRADGRTLPAFVARTNPEPKPTGFPVTSASAPPFDGILPRKAIRAWLNKRYAEADETEVDSKKRTPGKRKPPAKKTTNDGLTDYE